MQKHLDSQYRDRYELYYKEDGTIYDSRVINWRDVPNWLDIVKISVKIKDEYHSIHSSGKPRFKFFIRFREYGKEYINDEPKVINNWVIGWSNGKKCFLKYISFETGKVINETVESLAKLRGHLHDDIKHEY